MLNINPSVVASVESFVLSQVFDVPASNETGDVEGFVEGDLDENSITQLGATPNIQSLVRQITLSPFKNKFAKLNIGEILVKISELVTEDLMQVQKGITAIVQDNLDKINAEDARDLAERQEELMLYWSERFNQIGKRLRIYGIENVRTDPDGNTRFDFVQENFLEVKPYGLETNSPDPFDSEMKSRLEIANELKDAIQFEFFMDVTGEIIFKPPFYNMDVSKNTFSVIEDVDIISWNFNQNEAEVITRVDVTGQWHTQFPGGEPVNRGIWVDFEKAKRFGFRATERHFTWLNSPTACIQYAAGEAVRLNALARQGSVTIPGRPELRLGYPVYVPSRDAFYYVKGISHSFAFGGNFSTTLQLVAERRRKKDENGVPIAWEIFRNVGAVGNPRSSIDGTSVATDDSDNNYVKSLYLKGYCQFNTQTGAPQTIRPNFLTNRDEYIKSSVFGDWESFRNIKLGDDSDFTTEYQTTDGNGYELIPPFRYGTNFDFTDESDISKDRATEATSDQDQNEEKLVEDARKAMVLNDVDSEFVLKVNPNNIALTLDDETSSMLSIYNKDRRSQAEYAQAVDPTRSSQKDPTTN